jgi:hypothetical protein
MMMFVLSVENKELVRYIRCVKSVGSYSHLDLVFRRHNKNTNTFVVKLRLKLPLFNDKLVWNNKTDKSKGYVIEEGSYLIEKEFEWVSHRPKKKSL